MKKIFLLATIIGSSFLAICQPQHNWWYMPFNYLMEVNTTGPISSTALSNINADPRTGTSVSDKNGNLLFFTDGEKVYNNNWAIYPNNIMPNGNNIIGHTYNSQSSLIVPLPGSNNIYYLFNTQAVAFATNNQAKLIYSIVDMSLNGGLGDVTSTKNVILYNQTAEKLTAVQHQNGLDYWIITHDFNSNTFRVFLLTCNGLNTNPTLSSIGNSHNIVPYTIWGQHYGLIKGYMKANFAGNKLAVALKYENTVEVFDFNNSTGVVSNGFSFTPPYQNMSYTNQPWGVEFSPDDSKLYVSTASTQNPFYRGGAIFQYNMQAGSNAAIISSGLPVTNLNSLPNYSNLRDLMVANDGKIYFPTLTSGTNNLGVINNPNVLGVACNAIPFSVSAGGGQSDNLYSMPNLSKISYPDYEVNLVSTINNCVNASFTLNAALNLNNINWDFGDGTVVSNTGNSITHAYNNGGTYNVLVTYVIGGCTYSKTIQVVILPGPPVNLGTDITVCPGTPPLATLNATTAGAVSYLWSTGATTPIINVNAPGQFIAQATAASGCRGTDTINVSVYNVTQVNLGPDIVICPGQSTLLNATTAGAVSYLWSTGATTPTILATPTATYTVTVTFANGCTSTDQIIVKAPLHTNYAIKTKLFCAGTASTFSLPLNVGITNAIWSFGDGNTASGLFVSNVYSNPGNYTVTVTYLDPNGCTYTQTLTVTIPGVNVNLGPDITICLGQSVQINGTTTGGVSYIWNYLGPALGYSFSGPIITVNQAGFYELIVKDGNCIGRDTIEVIVLGRELPREIHFCKGGGCYDATMPGAVSYLWTGPAVQNPTSPILCTSIGGTYTLTVDFGNGCVITQTVNIIVAPTNNTNFSLGPDVSYCAGSCIQLYPVGLEKNPCFKYSWFRVETEIITNPPQPNIIVIDTIELGTNGVLCYNVTAGPQTIYLTITDTCTGCSYTDEIIITGLLTRNCIAVHSICCDNAGGDTHRTISHETGSTSLFPNPVENNEFILKSANDISNSSLQLYTSTGQELKEYKIESLGLYSKHVIINQKLAPGLYLAKLMDENGKQEVIRFIVQ